MRISSTTILPLLTVLTCIPFYFSVNRLTGRYETLAEDEVLDTHEPRQQTRLPNCTIDQFKQIQTQLPAEACIKNKNLPWNHQCSFTLATKCIGASWLTDYYKDLHKVAFIKKDVKPFLGISVGCNKGYDALNTMRMGTNNEIFNKIAWNDALNSLALKIHKPYCTHESDMEEQFSVDFTKPKHTQVGEMHCIEAFPPNYDVLNRTAEEIGIKQNGFMVTNAAISKKDGEVVFPTAKNMQNNSDGLIGVEHLSMRACRKNKSKKLKEGTCQKVQGFSLDTFVDSKVESKGPIDILTIDVEGFDFEVMLGGKKSLDRVQYLEFEYNYVGLWIQQKLSDAIRMLEENGMTCYWAGDDVLYRISGCWQEHYNIHHWSNVACVRNSHHKLAEYMEMTFLRTLSKDYVWKV